MRSRLVSDFSELPRGSLFVSLADNKLHFGSAAGIVIPYDVALLLLQKPAHGACVALQQPMQNGLEAPRSGYVPIAAFPCITMSRQSSRLYREQQEMLKMDYKASSSTGCCEPLKLLAQPWLNCAQFCDS